MQFLSKQTILLIFSNFYKIIYCVFSQEEHFPSKTKELFEADNKINKQNELLKKNQV